MGGTVAAPGLADSSAIGGAPWAAGRAVDAAGSWAADEGEGLTAGLGLADCTRTDDSLGGGSWVEDFEGESAVNAAGGAAVDAVARDSGLAGSTTIDDSLQPGGWAIDFVGGWAVNVAGGWAVDAEREGSGLAESTTTGAPLGARGSAVDIAGGSAVDVVGGSAFADSAMRGASKEVGGWTMDTPLGLPLLGVSVCVPSVLL